MDSLEQRNLLSLVPIVPSYPVITFDSNGVTNYSSVAQTLDVTATALRFRETGTSPMRTITGSRDLDIHINVDNTGQLVGAGTANDFEVDGNIDIDGDGVIDASGTLLTGKAIEFGYDDTGVGTDSFEFLFQVTGGSLASYFAGQDIGVTMISENSTFVGSFTSDFTGGAKGNVGTVPQVAAVPPRIAIAKSGPVIAHAGDKLTYTYDVLNPGTVPLSNVTVTDDQAGAATYVSGDANGNNLLDSGEDWTFSASYTPQFSSSTPLVNIATAQGTSGNQVAMGQASYTLTPYVLSKSLYLYWNGGQCNVPYTAADNTAFGMQVTKDGSVVDSFSITQAAGQGLWLSDGAYTFQEVNVPAGYINASGAVTYTTGQGANSATIANVVTSDLGVTKTGPAKALPGQTITYTYQVTNTGPAKVAPVLSDNLTGKPVYVSGDTNGDHLVGPGETWVFTSQYTVPNATRSQGFLGFCCCQQPVSNTSITNIVTVDDAANPHAPASQHVIGGDRNPANNQASWTVQVVNDSANASLSGYVYLDLSNNGKKDCMDPGISCVKITLTGVDDYGNAVSQVTYTDCSGSYKFDGLRSGTYTITESQPKILADGKDSLGNLRGTLLNDQFANIVLAAGAKGTCYNFGEQLKQSSCGGRDNNGGCGNDRDRNCGQDRDQDRNCGQNQGNNCGGGRC